MEKSAQSGRLHPESIAATADHYLDVHGGSLVPTYDPSTTFARDDRYQPLNPAQVYARDDAPTQTVAEQVLAELEQGSECRLFASGMAAVAAVFYTRSSSGFLHTEPRGTCTRTELNVLGRVDLDKTPLSALRSHVVVL